MINASTYLKAETLAASWPGTMKGGTNKVWAAAALIRWFRGKHIATNELKLPGGQNANWGALDWREALAVLAQSHDWLLSTPQEAQEFAVKGISILQKCRYAIESNEPKSLIAKLKISSIADAAKVSEKLSELSNSDKLNTDLAQGLMGALNMWLHSETNGWINKDALVTYRKNKGLRDKKTITKSQVARKLGKTYRQYHRYENGETPVPQDVAIELLEYLLPITPLLTSVVPKRSKGRGEFNVWLKGRKLN